LAEPNGTHRHVLNLGAGVQSTTLYLMYLRGKIQPQIECAIFADTGEEPDSIYRHLEWLKSLAGPPIVTVKAGTLGCVPLERAALGFDEDPRQYDLGLNWASECAGMCGV
jgi:hypothetical protein